MYKAITVVQFAMAASVMAQTPVTTTGLDGQCSGGQCGFDRPRRPRLRSARAESWGWLPTGRAHHDAFDGTSISIANLFVANSERQTL
jgi:hypothetical protein